MDGGRNLEHYILFAVALFAAIWFFWEYPQQDPRSAAKIDYSSEDIKLQAADRLTELGYTLGDYTVSDVSFIGNRQLLDSLQHKLGRQQATSMLQQSEHQNIKPYFWEVTFTHNEMQGNTIQGNGNGPIQFGSSADLRIRIDENGQFMSLVNPGEHLPHDNVQRYALSSVITPSVDTTGGQTMTAFSDSVLNRMLYFDMQKEHGNYTDYQPQSEAEVRTNLRQGIPYRHSVNDARAMADFYLQQTGWNRAELQPDTVFVQRIGSVNAANVRYSTVDGVYDQQLQINVAVAPTGALLGLQSTYNPAESQANGPQIGLQLIHFISILLLALAGIIIFFFRMRSRAIDTEAALVAAVVMGLIVPVSQFLVQLDSMNPFSANVSFDETVILFLNIGILGAISSICFFVLFAISDSITRQYWPQKLSVYDYLQRGLLFNKAVGFMVLRGVALAFVLAAFWTLLLNLFPQLYFSFNSLFVSEEAAWAPLYMLLTNSWFAFAVVCGIFLVIGSLAYGRTENKWLTAFVAIAASGLIIPFYKSFGPFWYELLQGAVFGAALTVIYFRWDFLTVFISHFLFLGLAASASGWIVPNSPDSFTFLVFVGVLGLLTVFAILSILMGKEEATLPEYVPSYVEELAQEQRIKQELHIAREVQQSFLPSKTPAYPGLDIAAVCQPAYETGGDYYDFIPLDDHRVAVAIGDVSGKGIQAAFYMTFVKGILHTLCRETDSPALVLKKMNNLFHDNASRGTFVSLVYGVVDLKKNTFTFARAGHNPILHVKTRSGKVNELQPNGLGIGLTKGKVFDNKIQEIELSITEDDMFLFYTDGIVEALNIEHKFYGTDKLIKLVKKLKHEPASNIVSNISDGVTRFIGQAKQHDDMTLMAIRFGNGEE